MIQLENNLTTWLILNKNKKKTITVKISIYFLSPIASFTKINTEVNTVLALFNALKKARISNFPPSQTLAIPDFFADSVGVRDGRCPLYQLVIATGISQLANIGPRKFRGRPPQTSAERPQKTPFDHLSDVAIWRLEDVLIWRPGETLKWCPGDVLIWCSRDVP